MKLIIAIALAISVGIASVSYAGGFAMLRVGSADGNTDAPITPCDQTGLDFTINCNMVLIPALIH